MTIRQNILWKNMLLSFGIMIIAYMGMALPEWLVSADWGDAFRPSALQQSIIGIFFGGMMLLLPLCAGITSGLEQAGEILSSMFVWKLGRSSIGKYARSQLVSAFLRSAFCVWAAFAVNAALWNIIAHPCDIAAYPYHEIGFAEDCLYAEWYCWRGGILMYLWMGAGFHGRIHVSARSDHGNRHSNLHLLFFVFRHFQAALGLGNPASEHFIQRCADLAHGG